jgi:UDP-GlcNAc:undecaprenyl-phosphate/decaprenyl-phosphate GlcNAc-1-phosphate transferase
VHSYLFSFASAFVVSVILTVVVRAAVRRRGLVARPRADRWHTRPTALLGGIAIYGAFLIAFLIQQPTSLSGEVLLLLCATGMFVLGLVDDLVHLKPYAKLVGQIICAAALSRFGLRLHWVSSPVIDQAITIFWLVGVTNALNLLDNLDGAAAGVAAIASAFLIYFCDAAGNPHLAALVAGFCGAVTGFLVFNVNPASIFMGDCGSLFIGFFLAGVAMINSEVGPDTPIGRNVVAVLFVPVLLLLIPILDTTLVTISRKLHGRPVSQGGRDHTSHRLVALGMSDRGAALTLWILAAASGLVAVMVQSISWFVAIFLIVLFGFALLFFAIFLGRVKVYELVEDEAEVKGKPLLPTIAAFAYKRRAFEVMNDLVLIVICYYGGFLLRFDGKLPEPFFHRFVQAMPVVIAVQIGCLLFFGLYRGLWRYTSMHDLPRLFRSVGGAWLASMAILALMFGLEGFSRAALIADGVFLFFAVVTSRIAVRLVHIWLVRLLPRPDARRVLIYGAGDGGELLVRELQNNVGLGLVPIGFLDDDPQKHGRVIHGVPVLGTMSSLGDLVAARGVEEVLVSTSKLTVEARRAFETSCRSVGLRTRRMKITLEPDLESSSTALESSNPPL